jgi:hypothetical protein
MPVLAFNPFVVEVIALSFIYISLMLSDTRYRDAKRRSRGTVPYEIIADPL